MNIHALVEQAKLAAVTEGYHAALEILYRAYEKTVADIRAARESSDSSSGTKQVLETLEFSDTERRAVDIAMQDVRQSVFEAVGEVPNSAILLYDALKDYASNEVKDYRDDLISEAKRGMSLPEEDVELPDVSVEELKDLRNKALAFWTVDGMPELEALPLTDEDGEVVEDEEGEQAVDPLSPKTKKLKGGELTLAFSNLPKNLGPAKESTDSKPSDGTRHSRLRYEVDGTLVPANTSLTSVALWYLSSYDWTLTVEEVKRVVSQEVGEWSNVDNFEVTINGHTLKRYRENI